MSFYKIIRWLIFGLTLASMGVFLLALLAPFSEHWFPAIVGLFYPYLLILNVGWVIIWLLLKPQYALLPIILLILTFPFSNRIFSLSIGGNQASSNQKLHVMSYNVFNFDLYNWSNNMASRNQMMELIGDENPDILCLQEFYTEDQGKFRNIEKISNEYNYPYHYFHKTYTARQTDHWGVITFSKYPIVQSDYVDYSNSEAHVALYTDVVVNEDTIRVFNTHLQSNHFASEDHKFMEQFSIEQNATDVRSFLNIFRKLIHGHQKRKSQAWQLRQALDESPHPLILCGDFNDTPISFTYQYLSQRLNDPFISAGNGFGQTFQGPIPLLRIDYILFAPMFRIMDYRIIKKDYSDHYPVSSRVKW